MTIREIVTPPTQTSAGDEVSIIGDGEVAVSERNVLVQPENVDEYVRLARGDLVVPLWTLSLFFLLFGIFGATVASVSHNVSFMTAFFYGYLIFTTVGGVMPNLSLNTTPQTHYLSRFSGEDMFAFMVVQQHRAIKVLWMLYFVLGYVMLAGLMYLAYLLVTWRCGFCRTLRETTGDGESLAEHTISSDLSNKPATCSGQQVTPVEAIPPRRIPTPATVLMGSRAITESRRSSAAVLVGKQTSIDLGTPDIEEGLLTLEDVPVEPEVEIEEPHSESDSGISKTGSDRAASGEEYEPERRTPMEEDETEDVAEKFQGNENGQQKQHEQGNEPEEEEEANMDDRITVKSRCSVSSVVAAPEAPRREVRSGNATPVSFAGRARHESATTVGSLGPLRTSKTPESIGSFDGEIWRESTTSEEIRDEVEPEVMRDIIDQISEEVALQDLHEDVAGCQEETLQDPDMPTVIGSEQVQGEGTVKTPRSRFQSIVSKLNGVTSSTTEDVAKPL